MDGVLDWRLVGRDGGRAGGPLVASPRRPRRATYEPADPGLFAEACSREPRSDFSGSGGFDVLFRGTCPGWDFLLVRGLPGDHSLERAGAEAGPDFRVHLAAGLRTADARQELNLGGLPLGKLLFQLLDG